MKGYNVDFKKIYNTFYRLDDLVDVTHNRVMNGTGVIVDNLVYFLDESSVTMAGVIFWLFLELDKYYNLAIVEKGLKRIGRWKDRDRIYFYMCELRDFCYEFSIDIDNEIEYDLKLTPIKQEKRYNNRRKHLNAMI